MHTKSKAITVIALVIACAACAVAQDRFGTQLLPLFMLDPAYRNINHGSYGSVPRTVMYSKMQWMDVVEADPDRWFRQTVEPLLADVRKDVAAYVKAASSEDVVFVENASDGFNAVAKSFVWSRGDKILRADTSYEMVKKTIDYLHNRYGVEALSVHFTAQTIQSRETILAQYEALVEAQPPGAIKLAVIDHIASSPAILFPIKEITAYLKSKNITVVIDGAHAVGAIPLDVPSYGADYYFSNFHKWGYAPKSAAFLWVRPALRAFINPNIISNYYGQGFQREFFLTGTRDFTTYVAVRDALAFRNAFGDKEIMQYMHSLCATVGSTVASIWGTNVLAPDNDMYGTMINVRLPTNDWQLAQQIEQEMFHEDNTYMFMYQFDGNCYARLSCQIYNDVYDFEYGANKFLQRLDAKLAVRNDEEL